MFRKIILLICLSVFMLTGCGAGSESHLKAGDKYLKSQDYEAALLEYKKAIMEDETLILAYRGAGIASLKLGDYAYARDMFLRSLKSTDGILDETELDTSYYLAEAQMGLGNYTDAIETYERISEVKKDEGLYYYRGMAYYRSGDIEKAWKDLNKAEKSKNDKYQYGIYQLYLEAGDYTTALEKNAKLQKTAGKDIVQKLLFDEIIIYEKALDYQTALVKAESYVAAYPEDEAGQKEYQFLQTR